MNRTFRSAAALCALTLLSACRIGDVWPFGSGSSTTPFPVKQAIAAAQANGMTHRLAASGTMASASQSVRFTGELTYAVQRAVPATFGGAPALMVADTLGGKFSSGGQSLEIGGSTFTYLNAAHDFIGDSGTERHCVAQAPGVVPAAVTAGQSGTLASYDCYTSNRRSTRAGTRTDSWFASAGPKSGTLRFRVFSVSTGESGETIASGSTTYLIGSDASLQISEMKIMVTENGVTTEVTAK